MTESKEHLLFEKVVQRIDPQGRLRRHWTLTGGISAQVTALEVERSDGAIQKIVVRRHGAADLAHNPNIAADEFALLSMLHHHGLPVPTPYHLDTSGTIFPTPYLVVEFVEGAPDFEPADVSGFIRQTAGVLAWIHQVDGTNAGLHFLPKLPDTVTEKLKYRPDILDESLDEGRIRAALETRWPLAQVNPSTLLHGDFWPGNLMWEDGRLLAVIDWEDALTGDPVSDLGNARLEILFAFGAEAMADFTQQYQTAMPQLDFANLPFWDLWAALRPAGKLGTWGLDAETEARMRERHGIFVRQALGSLLGS